MQFGSAPVVGALSFVRPAWHRPWRWKSSREPVTAGDSCSEGGGSYPGRFLALRLKEQRRLPPSARSGSHCRRQTLWRRPPVASAVPGVFPFSMQAQQSIVVDPKSPGSIDSPHGLILFDGVCVLCSRGCGFVSKRDRRGYFRFVPMQLAEGRPFAEQIGRASCRERVCSTV